MRLGFAGALGSGRLVAHATCHCSERTPVGSIALARSASAEMHSGFQALRGSMPMNIRGQHPGKGMTPESRKDIDRVVAIWTDCRSRFGGAGSLLFGRFSIPDAFYAPVVMRFVTYAVELPPVAQAYVEAVQALSAVREWVDAARRETEFVQADEPYAKAP